jgi:hypothetical protein
MHESHLVPSVSLVPLDCINILANAPNEAHAFLRTELAKPARLVSSWLVYSWLVSSWPVALDCITIQVTVASERSQCFCIELEKFNAQLRDMYVRGR